MRVSERGFVRNVPSVTTEREDERARLITKRALTDGRPGQRAPFRDAHLLEAELERALVHHDVEELGHVRLEHERGHAGSTDALGVHDAVGARPQELLLAVLAAGAGDDEQVGAQGSGAEDDERVGGVAVDGGDER